MIEFNGYLSGNAEKFFITKSKKALRNLLIFSMAPLLLLFIYLALVDGMWKLIIAYCSVLIFFLTLLLIPVSAKKKKKIIPQKVYTEDEYIVCVAQDYREHRYIDDAKKVIDHGEFYEIVYPLGKYSEKFICQKSLLIKGTLEDFEAKFEGKIERK